MSGTYNFYEDELKRIDTKNQYAPTLQIRNGDNPDHTKWMNLNADSAAVLIKWLQENYPQK